MTEPPFQPILLDLLRYARREQDAFVAALDPTERAATGAPDHWAAKDHVAHMTFWRRQLILKLQALQRHETPPGMDDYEQVNPLVFERQRQHPWSQVLAESDQAYDELLALAAQLGEDDLTASQRFDWIPDGQPLYTTFMGYCYEHAQQHLAQFALDWHDLSQALRIYEDWAGRVVATAAPAELSGSVLYNLACFYATHAEVEQAVTTLRRACTLHPPLAEFARTDPDLEAVRATHPKSFA